MGRVLTHPTRHWRRFLEKPFVARPWRQVCRQPFRGYYAGPPALQYCDGECRHWGVGICRHHHGVKFRAPASMGETIARNWGFYRIGYRTTICPDFETFEVS